MVWRFSEGGAGIRGALKPVKRLIKSWLSPVELKPLSLQQLAAEVTWVGAGVHVDPSVEVEMPQGLSIGNDVTIGRGVHIDAYGGVVLCDRVQVCDDVTIASSQPIPESACDPELWDERAFSEVFVGQDAWIGPGACILPGVTIGESAKIAAGALVSEDVPARTEFGLTHAGGELGAPVSVSPSMEPALPVADPTARRPGNGRRRLPNICFIASTGRSGSTTIADFLDKHPSIVARHEPRHQLVQLSTEYAHGRMTREEVRNRLERMFLDGGFFYENRIHVESDLKYFNLLPILNDIFPDAQFIWLMRSGYDVVTSTYSRSWFADKSHPVWRKIEWHYHKFRVQGDLSGDVSVDQWKSMNSFQRNCWYWTYVNQTIERDLSAIPKSQTMVLRLEDLEDRASEVLEFLGMDAVDLQVRTSNAAFYSKLGPDSWSPQQRADFENWCGPLMRRLYGQAEKCGNTF